MARIVVVAHKFLPQPDDDLVEWLNSSGRHRVMHVFHSFPDAPDRRSYCRIYEGGRLLAERQTRDYRSWPDPLVYLKELWFTLLWVGRGGLWDRYVGMDGLCVFFGHVLRSLGRVRSTVFWAIDFVPANRFPGRLKNWVYATINRHSATAADQMWDLGPRMADARERYAGIGRSSYREHRVVPYGMWLSRIRSVPYEECEAHTIVFMGHLLEKQGVQLVLRALAEVARAVPQVRFKVIGGGSYRPALEALAEELGVAARCDFMGKIDSPARMEEEVCRAAVAVAPYVRELDSWTLYADPGKVKTYLACGVPVALTDVPWNAREIEQADCGRIVSAQPGDIARALVAMLQPETNRRMRLNARRYAGSYDWPAIFGAALPPSTIPPEQSA